MRTLKNKKFYPPPVEEIEISGDLSCVTCRYNLRGLEAASNCPECGTPVRHSYRPETPQNSLKASDSTEHASLFWPLLLIVGGLLLLIARPASPGGIRGPGATEGETALFGLGCLVVGVWMLIAELLRRQRL